MQLKACVHWHAYNELMTGSLVDHERAALLRSVRTLSPIWQAVEPESASTAAAEAEKQGLYLAHFFRVGVLGQAGDDHLQQLLRRLRLLHQISRRSTAQTETKSHAEHHVGLFMTHF